MFFVVCSNLLLYASMYLLLPVLSAWLLTHWRCSYGEAGVITALPFLLGLFPLGPFNSYLIDRFKRKNVCLSAILLMGLLTLLYPYAEKLMHVMFIRFLQGVFFSIATMTTGSTLVIDFAVSKMRTQSNRAFVRFGRFGMVIGVALGLYLYPYLGFDEVVGVSALLAAASLLMILFLRIQFRAPLHPSKLSLDRFILPSALFPALNMLFAPFLLGLLIGTVSDEYFFFMLFASFLIVFLIYRVFGDYLLLKQELELGYGVLALGVALIYFVEGDVVRYIGAFLAGSSISMVSNRFLVMMISLPLHCGRGSGNNTYQLFWEVGVLIGFCASFLWTECHWGQISYLALATPIVGLLVYELILHKWNRNQMEKKY